MKFSALSVSDRDAAKDAGLHEFGFVRTVTAFLNTCGIAVSLAALGVLAWRAAFCMEIQWGWDALAYHLPFAILRGRLAVPYEMNETLRLFYEGFPPLPHIVQGTLWRLSGSVNGALLANYLALLTFLVYCRLVLRAGFWMVALISLTAPLVVIHATHAYVDLFGNALLAIGLASCLHLYLFPDRRPTAAMMGGLAGLVGAAWSKYQLVPLVGMAFCLLGVISLRVSHPVELSRKRAATMLLIGAIAAGTPYISNFVMYGNPFWPVRVPIIGDLLPYTSDAIASGISGQRPPQMKDYGQLRLFLHSLFEINHPVHYDYRPRWLVDQSAGWLAFRMGGFWGAGAMTYLLSTIGMLVLFDRKKGGIVGLCLVGFLVFLAYLPQSNELRYYMFVPLCWAAAIGMIFPELRRSWPLAGLAFQFVVLVLFGYMVNENRSYYEITKTDYRALAQAWDAPQWWAKFEPGKKYCAIQMMPMGILLTGPTMSEFSIVDRDNPALCPPDSIVVKGAQALVNDAIELMRAGRHAEAITVSKSALGIGNGLRPSYDYYAYNNICAADNALGQWDDAIEACTKAIQSNPGFELARSNLDWARKQKTERPSATQSSEAYLNESMTLFQAGRYAESIAAANKALALRADYADAWNNVCAAYNGMQKWDDAIAACTRAIRIKPDYALASNNLAWAFRMKAADAAKNRKQ